MTLNDSVTFCYMTKKKVSQNPIALMQKADPFTGCVAMCCRIDCFVGCSPYFTMVHLTSSNRIESNIISPNLTNFRMFSSGQHRLETSLIRLASSARATKTSLVSSLNHTSHQLTNLSAAHEPTFIFQIDGPVKQFLRVLKTILNSSSNLVNVCLYSFYIHSMSISFYIYFYTFVCVASFWMRCFYSVLQSGSYGKHW